MPVNRTHVHTRDNKATAFRIFNRDTVCRVAELLSTKHKGGDLCQ